MKPIQKPNVNNINKNDIIKNHKELCKLLEIDLPKGGKDRKEQIKDLERYFDYTKSGQKYIINEIYESPIPKKLFNKQTRYAEDLANALLLYFKVLGKDELYMVKNDLFIKMGMCNHKYANKSIDNDFNYEFPTKKSKEYNLNEFYKMSNNKLTQILNQALNSLKVRYLLRWEVVYMKAYNDFDITKPIPATIEEEQAIGNIIYNKLKEYNCSTEYEVFIRGLSNSFYKDVNNEVKNKIGCNYCFKAYHLIIYGLDSVDYEIKKRISNHQFNLNIIEGLQEELENKVTKQNEKANKETEWGLPENPFVYSNNFIDIQKKLIEYMIKLKE